MGTKSARRRSLTSSGRSPTRVPRVLQLHSGTGDGTNKETAENEIFDAARMDSRRAVATNGEALNNGDVGISRDVDDGRACVHTFDDALSGAEAQESDGSIQPEQLAIRARVNDQNDVPRNRRRRTQCVANRRELRSGTARLGVLTHVQHGKSRRRERFRAVQPQITVGRAEIHGASFRAIRSRQQLDASTRPFWIRDEALRTVIRIDSYARTTAVRDRPFCGAALGDVQTDSVFRDGTLPATD